MKSLVSHIVLIFATLIAYATAIPSTLQQRSGKPTGGPGIASLTVFSGGTYQCSNINSIIPTDASAGTLKSVSITEDQCSIIKVTSQSLMQAAMTQAPKSGTLGCYVQLYTQDGCGFLLNNYFWGQPIPGTSVGSKMGCAQVPAGMTFGGAELFCA